MILEIENRTENWGTARRLLAGRNDHVVKLLLNRLSDPGITEDAKMELFWRGYRDYCFKHKITRENSKTDHLIQRYDSLFPRLRERIKKFCEENPSRLRLNSPKNYVPHEDPSGFFQNVRNTEIDIVVETETALYIGEAKQTQGFNARGNLVLPHQLPRQYIVAALLVDAVGTTKPIVPFVVFERRPRSESGQLQLMKKLGLLKSENVFSWAELGA